MCSLRCDGVCEWNKQWREARPVGKSFSWERRAGDVTGERVFQKADRGDGPSCPSAAAAFCWRFSSVIPIQFYGLREFIIQLHLCLLADIERVKPISSRKSKRIHFNKHQQRFSRSEFAISGNHYSLVSGHYVRLSGMPVLRLWLLWHWSQSRGCCSYSDTKPEPF